MTQPAALACCWPGGSRTSSVEQMQCDLLVMEDAAEGLITALMCHQADMSECAACKSCHEPARRQL